MRLQSLHLDQVNLGQVVYLNSMTWFVDSMDLTNCMDLTGLGFGVEAMGTAMSMATGTAMGTATGMAMGTATSTAMGMGWPMAAKRSQGPTETVSKPKVPSQCN